jgi:XTP/dITP diphosphohydrolase
MFGAAETSLARSSLGGQAHPHGRAEHHPTFALGRAWAPDEQGSYAHRVGRTHVVVTSPRVAAGLLSADAWRLIAEADRVGVPDLDDPVAVAVRGAGVEVVEMATLELDDSADLVWLAPYGEVSWARDVAGRVVAADSGGEVEVVHGSYDLPGARLLDLVEVMDRLRRSCPWDRDQTHESLARYLLEEAYETLEAIDAGDREHLREELGDLLLQVMFHARIAAEDDDEPWDVDDVAGEIVEKLIRRHPHVFAGVEVADAEEVNDNWESIKASEKGRGSAIEGIPLALPALARADKLLSRIERAGLDGLSVPQDAGPAGQIGDRLLDVVRAARAEGVDAEQALRVTLARYGEAVRFAERSRT